MDQVNQNATFHHDDVFQRLRFAKLGMKLIDEHPADKGACTIAVDAPWGIGKSTFLHMWRHEIRVSRVVADNDPAAGDKVLFDRANRVAVYYNAWEHDDSEDAFAPLLWTIISTLVSDRYQEGMQLSADKVLEAVSFVTAAFAAFQPQNAAAVAIAAVTNAAKTTMAELKENTASKNVVDAIFKQQQDQQNNKAELRRCLSNLACACGKLVIFVDELDRCKPSFAIDTLETIKHYFDIPNLAFVFGIDMTQLAHAIGGRYGGKMDAGGYLAKFFDHPLRLPAPSAKQMVELIGESMSFDSETEEHVEQIFMACGVTPRDIQQVNKALSVLIASIDRELIGSQTDFARLFILLLLSMKIRRLPAYDEYISGNKDWDNQNWHSSYTFLAELLDEFSSFLSRHSYSCVTHWKKVVYETPHDKEAISASVGLAIIHTRRSTRPDTFAHILSAFLEQVYV